MTNYSNSCNAITILVIDDEDVFLRMVTRMLNGLGYTTLQAKTPAEAMGLAESARDKIDLVLTDVLMPEMNGVDLAKKIMEIVPSAKCLYMSGSPVEMLNRQYAFHPETHFISKPFRKEDLSRKIHDVLIGG